MRSRGEFLAPSSQANGDRSRAALAARPRASCPNRPNRVLSGEAMRGHAARWAIAVIACSGRRAERLLPGWLAPSHPRRWRAGKPALLLSSSKWHRRPPREPPIDDTSVMATGLAVGGDVEKALESVGVPSYVLDETGVVRWINAAAEQLLGDVRGRHFTSVVAPEDSRRARELFSRVAPCARRRRRRHRVAPNGSRTPEHHARRLQPRLRSCAAP